VNVRREERAHLLGRRVRILPLDDPHGRKERKTNLSGNFVLSSITTAKNIEKSNVSINNRTRPQAGGRGRARLPSSSSFSSSLQRPASNPGKVSPMASPPTNQQAAGPSTSLSALSTATLFRRLLWQGSVPVQVRIAPADLITAGGPSSDVDCYFVSPNSTTRFALPLDAALGGFREHGRDERRQRDRGR